MMITEHMEIVFEAKMLRRNFNPFIQLSRSKEKLSKEIY